MSQFNSSTGGLEPPGTARQDIIKNFPFQNCSRRFSGKHSLPVENSLGAKIIFSFMPGHAVISTSTGGADTSHTTGNKCKANGFFRISCSRIAQENPAMSIFFQFANFLGAKTDFFFFLLSPNRLTTCRNSTFRPMGPLGNKAR